MSQLVEDLKAAKALIDTPEKWTRDSWSSERIDGGACYCALGAGIYATGGFGYHNSPRREAIERALNDALPDTFGVEDGLRPTVTYNDDPATTHADIMALFDRAIAAAEGA